ncbi:hypothetical protein SeLEV6574_g01116 [Synchytrium endobioticum]|nr:hypothetical protein SeLEV6574_g01116 [Synchytrium endobioticum]
MAPVRVRRPGPLRAGGLHRQGARFVCYGAHGCRVIIYLQNDEPGVEHTIAFSGDPDDAEHRAVISKRDNGAATSATLQETPLPIAYSREVVASSSRKENTDTANQGS